MTGDQALHLWVEPHGDLTGCGIRRDGTRFSESATCGACRVAAAWDEGWERGYEGMDYDPATDTFTRPQNPYRLAPDGKARP